jgi:phosphoenolpyruvate-protein phosphotransferase
VQPSPALAADLASRRQAWLEERQHFLAESGGPACTVDGRTVEIAANAGSAADARAAAARGAEGIGLLRTEFLFLGRDQAPSEEEQLAALLEIGQAMAGRPVIVRTLDVGGDKPLPYLPIPPEPNPFLGLRATRLAAQYPHIFHSQLRAILRAGAAFPVRVMFPMIASLEEVAQARALLEQAHAALLAEGLAHAWPVETGIMVEVPSAALLAGQIAPQVDFFSIGTNDLTQYTLAAERGNPALAALSDGLHPAVLSLVAKVVEAASRAGRWVGVCGELAGDALAAPVLVGLGVGELSLSPEGIPRVKSLVRRLSYAGCQALARQALAAGSAAAARSLAQEFIDRLPGPGGKSGETSF